MADDLFTINLSELKELSAVLRRVEPQLQRELFVGLTAAAEIVAAKTRQNVRFSSRIPSSVAVKRRGLVVKVQAGGPAAPEAAPLEHGGIPGSFRHPVFGDRLNWVSQPAHPFLTPAVVETGELAFAAVLKAVDRAIVGISVG